MTHSLKTPVMREERSDRDINKGWKDKFNKALRITQYLEHKGARCYYLSGLVNEATELERDEGLAAKD